MFDQLEQIGTRPAPFEFYTVRELWTSEHTAPKMLACHLKGTNDTASRRFAFIDKSVDWIAAHFGLGTGSKLADFGCGPGLYTTRLAQKGVQVTGIDFSANSLRYAREQAQARGLEINYIHGNYLEIRLEEKFDLIIMIYCDFCALSPAQRKSLLEKFRACLQPGGHVLLDVHTLVAFQAKEEGTFFSRSREKGFWLDETYYEFLNKWKYEQEKVSLDKYTIIAKEKTFTIYNWLQYFDRDSLAREFGAAGLTIKEYFSDVAGKEFSPREWDLAIVAGR